MKRRHATKILKKSDIDSRLASELGMDRKEVAAVTTALFELVRDQLIELTEVQLPGLGRLLPRLLKREREYVNPQGEKRRGMKELRVYFAKGEVFKMKQRLKYTLVKKEK